MAQKRATHLPPGMCLSVTMRDSHSVRDLKQMYGKTHPGTSLDKLVITYSGRVLENNDLSITRYGVPPGEYRLVFLFGEGFSVTIKHIYGYTLGEVSGVFNSNDDAYHDSKRQMAELTKKCVKEIVDKWYYEQACGETFYVKDLMN